MNAATAFGHLAVVDVGAVDEAAFATLHEHERALCAAWGVKRQATFIAGRRALRQSLRLAGCGDVVDQAIGRDARGAPVLPPHARRLCASVTHKDSVAAGLVDVDGAGFVGVDLEVDDGRDRTSTDKLAAMVLTPRELQTLPDDDDARRRAVFARFSLKEALYKAVDRYVARYVGFKEVEVDVDGSDAVFVVSAVGSFVAHGAIQVVADRPGIILTVARVVSSPAVDLRR